MSNTEPEPESEASHDTETDSANHSRESSERSLTVHHQAVFAGEQGAEDAVDEDRLLELDDTPFETTLGDHDVAVDTRPRTSRIETTGSDEFVDDRLVTKSDQSNASESSQGQQGTLFTDTAVDQRTLDGDRATSRFLFESE